MKLLFVTHLFPYPPIGGGRIGYFNPIRYLSRQMEVVLVSIVDSASVQLVDKMAKYCIDIKVHQMRRSPYVGLIRGVFTEPPGAAAKYYDPRFGQLIQEATKRWDIDIVEFQHLNTACYRSWVRSSPAILREHNIEHKVWERQAQNANSVVERMYVSFMAPRVRTYEAKLAPQFDRCIAVSEADARHLRAAAPTAKIETIPSGVDTEYFVPTTDIPEEPFSMVLTGSFDWQPKQHNLRVLLTKCYPKIRAKLPAATLKVVGTGVPEDLQKLASALPGVTITGKVPDVRPFISSAALALNFLESGGGIALKVLEAMAMRKPVLSNSMGCEGIKVTHGENVFLADGSESFADAAVFLLQNVQVRQRIAEAGYQLVKQDYAWDRLAGRFIDCYASVLSERTPTRHPAEDRSSVFPRDSEPS